MTENRPQELLEGYVLTLGQFRVLTSHMSPDLRIGTYKDEIQIYDDSVDIEDPEFDFSDPEWESYCIDTMVCEECFEEYGVSAFIRC